MHCVDTFIKCNLNIECWSTRFRTQSTGFEQIEKKEAKNTANKIKKIDEKKTLRKQTIETEKKIL